MVSFLTVAALPITILQIVLARNFSEFNAKDQRVLIKALFRAFIKRILFANSIILILFLLFSKNIASFLNLPSSIFIMLTFLSILFGGLNALSLSILQGIQSFPRIAIIYLFQVFIKLSAAILFVSGGLKALGAFLSFSVADAITFLFAYLQIPRWIFKLTKGEYKNIKVGLKLEDIYKYFFPVTLALISYTFFTNSDVLLVKHFFNPSDAGIYSIAQTVGKMILFLPNVIILVFFPITVQKFTENKDTLPLVERTLLFIGTLCILISLLAFVFPKLFISMIAGKVILECVPLVKFIVFPMILFALSYIFIYYNLSIKNVRYIVLVFALSVLQVIMIYLFHRTLIDVIRVLLLISSLTFYFGMRSIYTKRQYARS